MPPSLSEPDWSWSKGLPRTVGITIDSGTRATALPNSTGELSVQSMDFHFEVSAEPGNVLPVKENWLLKIMDVFGLSGIKIVLSNINPHTCSAGLGGSATATSAVCILANELAGRPFRNQHLVSLASRIEQHFGVSITGTQEQSNVLFGGIVDYVWMPWGLPENVELSGHDSGFGTSLRRTLLPPARYRDLQDRICVFHTGKARASTDVNSVWVRSRFNRLGYDRLKCFPEIAYEYGESIRKMNWGATLKSIEEYRRVRTDLCSEYMAGALEIHEVAEVFGGTSFPLGAGGGGTAFVFAPDPNTIMATRNELVGRGYTEICVKIREHGHEILNCEDLVELGQAEDAGLVSIYK